jgi:hypothetical protein
MEDPTVSNEESENPYLALRAAKIARNEARLKELGLWKQPPASKRQAVRRQKRIASSSPSPSATTDKKPKGAALVVVTPRRRSARISGLDHPPNYKEDSIVPLRKAGSNDIFVNEAEVESQGIDNSHVASRKRTPAASTTEASIPAPPKANSVRGLALNMTTLVDKFLGKPLANAGKEFVIEETFQKAAASQEDLDRLGGVKLSFNKYCGVQQWKNGAFLWVNMGGGGGASNTVVNEFLEEGRLVTWFGGSRMDEESSVIQTLIQVGKEASAKFPVPLESGIVLWCRQFYTKSKKFGPYVCLGRLGYHSHVPGSYPVAFTWKLLDRQALTESSEKRKVFESIRNS